MFCVCASEIEKETTRICIFKNNAENNLSFTCTLKSAKININIIIYAILLTTNISLMLPFSNEISEREPTNACHYICELMSMIDVCNARSFEKKNISLFLVADFMQCI